MSSNPPTPGTDLSAAAEREAYRLRLDALLAGRDAGNTLTLDSLRAGIRPETVVSAAAAVAAFADEALAIISDEYRPPLHCKASCWSCGSKPGALLSIPDLLRILPPVRA